MRTTLYLLRVLLVLLALSTSWVAMCSTENISISKGTFAHRQQIAMIPTQEVTVAAHWRPETDQDAMPQRCTMASCFDFDRCRHGFTIYIYPDDPSVPLKPAQQPFYDAVDLLKRVIRERFNVVTDPQKACLFLNPYETSCEGERCRSDPEHVSAALAKLPFWNNGRNHIINFYGNDGVAPSLFSIGQAMVLSGSLRKLTYRPGFDVMLPLTHFFKHKIQDFRLSRRDLLLYFQGSIYGDLRDCAVRGRVFETLSSLAKHQPDVLLFGRCGAGWDKEGVDFTLPQYPKACRPCQDGSDYCNGGTNWTEPWVDYRDGLHRARFGLAPSGCGPLSYRLLETIFSGGVPVQIGDDSVLPLEGDDSKASRAWKRCTIFAAEASLPYLLDGLRNMPSHEYHDRLHACTALVRAKQNDLYHIFWLGICTIAGRIQRSMLSLDIQRECHRIANLFDVF